jgi:hypothetical protein
MVVIGDEKNTNKVKEALKNEQIKVFAGEQSLEVTAMDSYDMMLAVSLVCGIKTAES